VVAGGGIVSGGSRVLPALSNINNASKVGQASSLLSQTINANAGHSAANVALNATSSQRVLAVGGGVIGAKLTHDAISSMMDNPYHSPDPILFSANSGALSASGRRSVNNNATDKQNMLVNTPSIFSTSLPIHENKLTVLPSPPVINTATTR
jgi:hypothetical protein